MVVCHIFPQCAGHYPPWWGFHWCCGDKRLLLEGWASCSVVVTACGEPCSHCWSGEAPRSISELQVMPAGLEYFAGRGAPSTSSVSCPPGGAVQAILCYLFCESQKAARPPIACLQPVSYLPQPDSTTTTFWTSSGVVLTEPSVHICQYTSAKPAAQTWWPLGSGRIHAPGATEPAQTQPCLCMQPVKPAAAHAIPTPVSGASVICLDVP